MEEQLIKTVVRSGNGGIVWVPKEWINERVIVLRPDIPKLTLNQEIIKVLEPFLEDVIAVFLYGSYARNEQEKDSDIDFLVIAKNEFKVSHKKFEIKVITYDKLIKTIKENPIMFYPFILEAKPIMNSKLLEELKRIEIDYKKFDWFLETTKDIININKEILELDKLEGAYLKSLSVVYSLILRLKGLFLINCIKNKEKYYNKNFKAWLLKTGLNKSELNKIIKIYKLIKNGKISEEKIKISTLETLLNLLGKGVIKLKNGK